MELNYDVALSFAGEDRAYVERVAACLRAKGVRVFYDAYEKATLWGKDLYVHLANVYQRNARFTVMFVSHHYSTKLWTNHERQSAQARAFSENKEYILPVRFDDTEVPGLPPTIGYIDIRKKEPFELCALIIEKLSAVGVHPTAIPRHRPLEGGEALSNEASLCTTLWTNNQPSRLAIAVDPTRYETIGELLDETYSHYLHLYLKPYTYGQRWIIERGKQMLAPWQWVGNPCSAVHQLSPQWYTTPLSQLGIKGGTVWSISAINEQPREMTWRTVQAVYLFCTDDELVWNLVCEHSKAIYILKSEGYIRLESLSEAVAAEKRYCGVFEDWLNIGSGCSWVHGGKQLPDSVFTMFRY
jgi:hypothetical protein